MGHDLPVFLVSTTPCCLSPALCLLYIICLDQGGIWVFQPRSSESSRKRQSYLAWALLLGSHAQRSDLVNGPQEFLAPCPLLSSPELLDCVMNTDSGTHTHLCDFQKKEIREASVLDY